VPADDRELDFGEREIVLRADFHSLDEESCLEASVRFLMSGPRPPREGEWVYLLDAQGDGCLGQVESINGWSARVRPDWTTWAGAQSPPVQDPDSMQAHGGGPAAGEAAPHHETPRRRPTPPGEPPLY
jgi:hypothetical protein